MCFIPLFFLHSLLTFFVFQPKRHSSSQRTFYASRLWWGVAQNISLMVAIAERSFFLFAYVVSGNFHSRRTIHSSHASCSILSNNTKCVTWESLIFLIWRFVSSAIKPYSFHNIRRNLWSTFRDSYWVL